MGKVPYVFFANLKTNYRTWSREEDPITGVEQKIMTAIIYHHLALQSTLLSDTVGVSCREISGVK